ncbi:alpha/beta fold hydrolase [Winogradskyella sp.]|uniref:alpha/beta fold hydrolase n=1 Tax=Winogradskyella sp. TaxID=1883156 RepID=UPI00262E269E|nr:alpha/beta fold hydrolase [Winogradskyella sp.]
MRHLFLIAFILITLTNCESQARQACALPYSNLQSEDRCGFVEVPRNWDIETDETTSLGYLVIRSQSKNRKDDPVVFLQGGPGGNVLDLANIYSQINLDSDRDFILYDQRGVGFSEELCPDLNLQLLEIMALDLNIEEEIAELKKRVQSCTDYLKTDPRQFSTATNAKDLEALRQHLGYKQLNLFGGSYGTRLGLKYMELYPNHVRSAILSGLFPPEIRMYDHLFSSFSHSFNKMFSDCAKNSKCNTNYPNLKTEFLKFYSSLKAKPIQIFLNGTNFVLNQQDILLFIHQMLYKDSTIEALPKFILALKNRDKKYIAGTINSFLPRLTLINLAVYYSIMTADEGRFNNQAKLNKDSRDLLFADTGLSLFSADPEVIKIWPSVNVESNPMQPVKSNIPTLLISGEYDPVTPPSNGDTAAKRLRLGQHVIFSNDGHVPINTCFFSLAKQFLDNPKAELNGNCARANTKFNWD